MIKAVIDTNIFVSGLLNTSGAPAKLILRWFKAQFEVLLSEQVTEEYEYVLRHLDNVEQTKVAAIFNEFNTSGVKVVIPNTLKVCKDPDDDKFLETAIVGKADYLVTKNTKHFPHKSYQGIRIVKISAFLKELEKHFPD
jgi:putative PIN family toxin of toxin-antitoxin system